MEPTPELTESEMVEILKEIARDGRNGAARIAAIRELKAWRAGEKPQEDKIGKLYAIGKPGKAA